MQYRTIKTDDIDELFSWGGEWDEEFLQLSAGPLGFQTRLVTLPGLSIQWNSCQQSVLFREVVREPAVVFGAVLAASGPPSYRGREMADDQCLVWHPGQEHEYTVKPGIQSLVVGVEPRLAGTFGWRLGPQPLMRVPQPLIDKLVAECRQATVMARGSAANTAIPETEEVIRDRVILALHDALAPWLASHGDANQTPVDPSRDFRVVKQAEHLMAQWAPGDKLDVGRLAAELEVSPRVLYESFRRWLGIGPYEFHLLKKLHAFREALVSGKPFHGKIKQAAMAAGFRHLGRLTQSYRRHFGESPRETLKRRFPQ